MRTLLRMERSTSPAGRAAPSGVMIGPWTAAHHEPIREVYGLAFGDDPWPDDWDRFEEFDPDGVFVATARSQPIGFAICFPREDFGYISVVAVVPDHQRNGVASGLVARCIDRIRTLGFDRVRIDAYEDSPPAVLTYRSLGFEVYETKTEE